MTDESQNKQINKESEMLEEHKRMLIMTGKLSDFQLENLKKWPFIVFDSVDKVEIEYDFSETKKDSDSDEVYGICAGKVVFNLEATEPPKKNQIDTLKQWTKFLFWKDTKVEVNLKV